MESYLSGPVHGGNQDMTGWKLVGFPGVRYDCRDWIERHGGRYPRRPVGLTGRPGRTTKG